MWQAYILAYGLNWAGREEWEGGKYLIVFWFQWLEGGKEITIIYNVVTRRSGSLKWCAARFKAENVENTRIRTGLTRKI